MLCSSPLPKNPKLLWFSDFDFRSRSQNRICCSTLAQIWQRVLTGLSGFSLLFSEAISSPVLHRRDPRHLCLYHLTSHPVALHLLALSVTFLNSGNLNLDSQDFAVAPSSVASSYLEFHPSLMTTSPIGAPSGVSFMYAEVLLSSVFHQRSLCPSRPSSGRFAASPTIFAEISLPLTTSHRNNSTASSSRHLQDPFSGELGRTTTLRAWPINFVWWAVASPTSVLKARWPSLLYTPRLFDCREELLLCGSKSSSQVRHVPTSASLWDRKSSTSSLFVKSVFPSLYHSLMGCFPVLYRRKLFKVLTKLSPCSVSIGLDYAMVRVGLGNVSKSHLKVTKFYVPIQA